MLVHNSEPCWYHGTDEESAVDILRDGLNKDHMNDIISDVSLGFYVTDDPGMAQSFADLRGIDKPGVILEMSDSDIGHLLIGDGTKLHEAVIPFDSFDQVKPDMIRIMK